MALHLDKMISRALHWTPIQILGVTILMAEMGTALIVSGMSLWFHGEIRRDYLITGVVTALLVSLLVVSVMLHLLHLLHVRINAARQANEALQTTLAEHKSVEDALRILLNIEEDIVLVRVHDRAILYANPKFERMFGYDKDELNGQHVSTLNAPTDKTPAEMAAIIQDTLKQTGRWTGEIRNRKKDGTEFWCYATVSTFEHPTAGTVWVSFHQDISEKKRLKEEIDQLFSVVNDLLCIADTDGYFRRINPSWEKVLGYSMEELTAQPFITFVHPEDIEPTRQAIALQIKQRPIINFVNRYRTKAGDYRWLEWHSIPVGNLLYAAARDITERRLAEISLAEAKEMAESAYQYSRSLIEASQDPLVTISAEGKITDVNKATEQVTGVARNDLIDSDFSNYFTEPEQARTGYQQVFAQGFVTDYPLAIRHVSGKVTDVLYNASVYRDAHGTVQGVFAAARDISDRKRIERAIKNALAQAEAANRAKSEFLAAMSHEIRTPMNVVLGMSEMLLETELNAVQRRFVQTMHHSGRALMGVINDVLDFSRIEAGHLTLVEIPFSPRQVVEETARLMQVAAEEKGLTLEVAVAPNIPKAVLGDDGRIRQVLINLLGNAIKFTHQGRVDVCLTPHPQEPAMLLIRVTDTGIGISQEQIDHIFDLFIQADAGISRRYGGTGLGLAISRRLAELMGGQIEVTSQLGQGSSFCFTLPMRIVASVTPLVEEPSTTVDTRSLRILLAEDVEENQMLFEAYLMQTPHQLVMVDNGMEAIERVQKETFDVVVMDVQMPKMDGYTATRHIRQWEQAMARSPVPIIALSAHAMAGEKERSREAGCDIYLSKPIKKQALLHALQQIARHADQDVTFIKVPA
ncbi:MAG: PAS domain S-box protein [Magnetococcales bacterium]|nr:PAS domain S-box protein [Magnetococcales bacterium]